MSVLLCMATCRIKYKNRERARSVTRFTMKTKMGLVDGAYSLDTMAVPLFSIDFLYLRRFLRMSACGQTSRHSTLRAPGPRHSALRCATSQQIKNLHIWCQYIGCVYGPTDHIRPCAAIYF